MDFPCTRHTRETRFFHIFNLKFAYVEKNKKNYDFYRFYWDIVIMTMLISRNEFVVSMLFSLVGKN